MYTDVTVLLAPSAKGLQQLIQLCEVYANICDIIFNVIKSKYNVPTVYLNDKSISLVIKYKYLGFMTNTGWDK